MYFSRAPRSVIVAQNIRMRMMKYEKTMCRYIITYYVVVYSYYDIDRLGSIHEVDRANILEEYNYIDRVM
jgi:hypothetical protein